MSDKLKIYEGSRKILGPKKCQFCLYQHYRENTRHNRKLAKLCYPLLNQATYDNIIFDHMYDPNYMDNIDFSTNDGIKSTNMHKRMELFFFFKVPKWGGRGHGAASSSMLTIENGSLQPYTPTSLV